MELFHKLRLKEMKQREFFEEHPEYPIQYPHLDDPNLQRKISVKKEFRTYKYDGTIGDLQIKANKMCKKNKLFELSPHQEFIKRFISYQTPYNGVLLFHGLGSGKTCSAIGITESIRSYSKYISDFKKILIIASPNVQDNFRLQLFNPSKLAKINNSWNLTGCLGNSLIQELNVYQINNLSKEELVSKINKIISNYYEFLGYIEFANRIDKSLLIKGEVNPRLTQQKLKAEFEGSLIVIDEIHNIRQSGDSNKGDKKSASSLFKLVNYVKYLKIIFLTGTPMYNDPKEILYILNILNLNDNRSPVSIKEVFDKDGEFKSEEGKQLFLMKANGYVSYVRGENPYIFPYLVTPNMYGSPHSVKQRNYPRRQFNKKQISNPIQYLDLYLSKLSETQFAGYQTHLAKVTEKFSDEEISKFEDMESFRYNEIMGPIQSLNIVYPIQDRVYVGNRGLEKVMTYDIKENPPARANYEYVQLDGMFSYERIGEYSSKIKVILDHIINSTGIILIYSQYIDGGIIPMALALEELGFIRYKSKNLFKKKRPALSINDLKRQGGGDFIQATYSIICGDKLLSPNTNDEIEALTNDNTNGERVKVVIISQAGTEGLDLNHIRQVHIMEPWYNMNRLEQIIGRARRNCSHSELPLQERNVQVFLHATDLGEIESMDMYLYRLSEKKAIKIGKITRLLKSVSVDCLLNKEQQDFYKMSAKLKLRLSQNVDGRPIVVNHGVKDEAYTSLCDYMETCQFECINEMDESKEDAHTYEYASTKNTKVMDIIKELFKLKHVYKKEFLLDNIMRRYKSIHKEEILRALKDLEINTLVDKFGRKGYIIKTADIYFFQPIEIKDTHVTMTERMIPITSKPSQFSLTVDKVSPEVESESTLITELKQKYENALHEGGGSDDWYMYFYEALDELSDVVISGPKLEELLMEHICEELTFEEEVEVLNYMASTDDAFNEKFVSHFSKTSIEAEGLVAQLLLDPSSKDQEKLYVLNQERRLWELASYTERGILLTHIKSKFVKPKGPFFSIVGFMGKSKNGKLYEFKIKESDSKFTGAVFENKSKPQIMTILNQTLEIHDAYNKKNTASTKKNVLAIVEECLLRHFDKQKRNNKRYFLNKLEYYYLQKN